MNTIQMDINTLVKIKVTQQTAVLEHFFSKNPQTFNNLRYNKFLVPKKRDFLPIMEKSISLSTDDESCSDQEETIESPLRLTCKNNEESIHYSNILPASDKKTEAINTLLGIFYSYLL